MTDHTQWEVVLEHQGCPPQVLYFLCEEEARAALESLQRFLGDLLTDRTVPTIQSVSVYIRQD